MSKARARGACGLPVTFRDHPAVRPGIVATPSSRKYTAPDHVPSHKRAWCRDRYTRDVKVLVIGAGVVGCAVAHALARRSVNVDLVDMRGPAGGSTQAAAGVLAPWIEAHSGGLLALGEASLRRYDAFIARVREESRVDVEYQRTGTVEVALNAAQETALRADAARHEARGVPIRWLDRAAVLAMEPGVGLGVRAGLLLPEQGFVRARDLTLALADAAERAGATIHAGVRVDAVESGASGITAQCGDRLIEADCAVLAAGSWSGQDVFTPTAATPVTPVRGQLLHLRAAAPLASRVVWGTDCYLVPWTDGSLLVGGTVEQVGFDERPTDEGVQGLRRAAAELLPASALADLQEVRVGLRPGTPDGVPVIGRAAANPRVIFATGHYRNGVLLAPLTADLVADLVVDGREGPELALMAPARFGL